MVMEADVHKALILILRRKVVISKASLQVEELARLPNMNLENTNLEQ
jgi:hypothetical protein